MLIVWVANQTIRNFQLSKFTHLFDTTKLLPYFFLIFVLRLFL